MQRIRWFKADWPISLRALASKMRADPFKEDGVEGFIVDRVREDSVQGRFIEKISYKETIKSPFGEERVFDRIIYTQLEFNLTNNFPHLELVDPPRSTQSYISKLLEFSNFALSVEPLSVDLIEWTNLFQATVKQDVTINSVHISGLEIQRGVTAKVVVTGDKDVRGALELIARKRQYRLEKVHLQVFSNGAAVPIYLSNSGSARLETLDVDEFLPALRSSLPRKISKRV
jgi:hypothetical protein